MMSETHYGGHISTGMHRAKHLDGRTDHQPYIILRAKSRAECVRVVNAACGENTLTYAHCREYWHNASREVKAAAALDQHPDGTVLIENPKNSYQFEVYEKVE